MKSTFLKINRKFDQLKRQYIPRNQHYKPSGVVPVSLDYYKETRGAYYEHINLASDQSVELPMSEEMFKALHQATVIDKFDKEKQAFTAQANYFINIIPNGRLYSDNLFIVWVISADNMLLGDSSFQFYKGYSVDPKKHFLVPQTFFKKPQKISGTVCSLLCGGGGPSNYYHWMIDVLPRLHLLKKAGWLDKVDHFVVPNAEIEFQKASLQAMGISEDKLIVCKSTLHLEAERLISTSHPRSFNSILIPHWVVDFHRKCFLHLLKEEKSTPEKIYISRQDTPLRPIYNEAELMDYLKANGFAIYQLSELPLLEKIRLFHQARVVVGATGAGMTNLLYCQPETKVLEIFGKDDVHTHYYNLAYHVQADYHFVECRENNNHTNKSRKQAVLSGFYADIVEIAQTLEKMQEDGD
jgi:hypothetical protein